MSLQLKLGAIIAVSQLCLLSACSLRTPTQEEQQALTQKGAFPSALPPWISSSVTGGQRASTGFIPESFTARSRGSAQRSDVLKTKQTLATSVVEFRKRQAAQIKQDEATAAHSPLGRILSRCPEVESAVNEALTTTRLKERIQKYEALTKRCSQSEDLWLWLSKDYIKSGQSDKAEISLQRVLYLNRDLAEAQALLTDLRTSKSTSPPEL